MNAKMVKLPWMETLCEAKSGRAVVVDGWTNTNFSTILQDCEMPEFAPFRLPSAKYTDIAYACDIEITGRVARALAWCEKSLLWVRVKITWIHDGEPNETSYGWMVV